MNHGNGKTHWIENTGKKMIVWPWFVVFMFLWWFCTYMWLSTAKLQFMQLAKGSMTANKLRTPIELDENGAEVVDSIYPKYFRCIGSNDHTQICNEKKKSIVYCWHLIHSLPFSCIRSFPLPFALCCLCYWCSYIYKYKRKQTVRDHGEELSHYSFFK